MSPTVEVRDGTVRLPAALVAAHFAGVEAVVVLIRAGAIEILPVRHMEAGGCLLKQRTRAGDRVASAPDVFRRCGLGEWRAEALPACWSPAKGALVVALPKAAK